MLHKDTLDSHRVRAHNAYSILVELKELATGWKQNRIKQFETVKFCVAEALDILRADTCIDYMFYDKELFRAELTDYEKTDGKFANRTDRIIRILDRCLEHNRGKYLAAIFAQLDQQLFREGIFEEKDFMPTLKPVDALATALACELIRIGYAKAYLYAYFKNLALYDKRNFRSRFDAIRDKFLTAGSRTYTVILKVRLPESEIDRLGIAAFTRDIPGDYDIPEEHKKFASRQKSNVFYRHECRVADGVSAVKKAKAALASLLDVLHLGMSRIAPVVDRNALVICNGSISRKKTDFVLDGNYSNDANIYSRFKQQVDTIQAHRGIDLSVKNRLDSALRHLRVGSTSPEIEQQFINYWIALEFIFSSGETSENTYTRLKENLTNILTCCYAKRNLLDLNQTLIDKGEIDSGTSYWEQDDVDGLIGRQSSLLLRYRLLKMKSHLFGHADKRKDYIQNHEKNLLRHLARIYRMRNELIHEAAIKQDIEGVTSNLRYYLVFLLNQFIVYFAHVDEDKTASLDDFFLQYGMWKKCIETTWKLDPLLAIPVELDLLK